MGKEPNSGDSEKLPHQQGLPLPFISHAFLVPPEHSLEEASNGLMTAFPMSLLPVQFQVSGEALRSDTGLKQVPLPFGSQLLQI